jgi:hypothetical protein
MRLSEQVADFGSALSHIELLRLERSPVSEPPVASIVVPAFNEAITIGEFIDSCWEGLKHSGVPSTAWLYRECQMN